MMDPLLFVPVPKFYQIRWQLLFVDAKRHKTGTSRPVCTFWKVAKRFDSAPGPGDEREKGLSALLYGANLVAVRGYRISSGVILWADSGFVRGD